MKILKIILKKAVISISIIYTLDIMLNGANIFIPINIPNILIGMILGPLGITVLIAILIINK